MGRKGKEKAKERRERRRQEISELRKLPISPCQRWWSSETVVVVTGANRGIGLEISRQLAAYGLHVVMTSRDADCGLQAAGMLQNEGLNVKSYQLDISDQASIESFSKLVVLNYGGIDILVSEKTVAHKHRFPPSAKFNGDFHVSLLKLFKDDCTTSDATLPPLLKDVKTINPDRIVKDRSTSNGWENLVGSMGSHILH